MRPSVWSIVCGVDGRGDYLAHIEVRWRSRKKGIIQKTEEEAHSRSGCQGEGEGGSEVDGESGERSPMRR